jgi:NAD(P)-dependent dehydrogenase (short-subunit alcohol dehydrogenase family)
MVGIFGATSTTDEVLSGVNLRGKRILVTGVSAGLGVETARSLVAHGAQVVGAARDLAKAERATAQVSATSFQTMPPSVVSEGVRAYALDATNAEALWKKSEEMIGESF